MSWQPIETAPKDGSLVLLYCPARHYFGASVQVGSFRLDAFANEDTDKPLWLKDDYDDFSTGYASTPLEPTHWLPFPDAPDEPRYELTDAGREALGGGK